MVHIEKLILGVPALIGLAAILSFMVNPGYGVWVDRDMLRATQLAEHFQVMGAELNGSYYARTPGGAYYYLLGLLTAISKDPLVVSRLLIILSALGGFGIFWAACRIWGNLAGIVAVGFWLASPIVLGTGFHIINPAFGVPISAICYLLLIYYVLGRQTVLPWLAFLVGVAIQTHISYLALLITLAVGIALFSRPSWRIALASIAALLLNYVPYLVSEIRTGFSNSRLLVLGENEPNPIYTSARYDTLDFFVRHIVDPFCPDSIVACNTFQPHSWFTWVGGLFFVVMLARIVLAMWRWRYSVSMTDIEKRTEQLVLILGTILILGTFIVVFGRGISFQYRYYMFMAPAMALLYAAAALSTFTFLRAKSGVLPGLGRAVVVMCLIFATGGVAHKVSSGIISTQSTDVPNMVQAANLIQAIKDVTGFRHSDIKGRVMLIDKNARLKEHYISYLARIIEASDSAVEMDGADNPSVCVAVVDSASKDTARELFERYMVGKPFPPREVVTLGAKQQFSMFAYRLENGNCYKSIGNSYDHFPQELRARELCDLAGQDGVVWQENNGSITKAVVRETFEKVRLCFWIDFLQKDGKILGNLHSWQGRSYSGYPIDHWSFIDLALEFTGSGATVREPLISAHLGRFKYSRMPWKFLVEAPGPDQYDVAVTYDMAFQITADVSREVFDETMPRHKARQVFPIPIEISP